MAAEKPIISLKEFLERSPKTPGELQAIPGPDLPAELPASPDLSQVPEERVNLRPESRVVMINDPRSPGADRFRYLRMHLRALKTSAKLQSLVITSPLPRDGKSTVTINLATVLAEHGKRAVLVIEADLHQPALAKALGLAPRPGLAECLEKNLDPLSGLRRLDPLRWYLLQGGQPQSNPTELVQSAELSKVLAKLAPLFDWILIDTPPVAPLTDALSISRQTDATLLVVRADHTPREAVDDAVSHLGANRVAAIVFNGAHGLNRLYSKYSRYYGKS